MIYYRVEYTAGDQDFSRMLRNLKAAQSLARRKSAADWYSTAYLVEVTDHTDTKQWLYAYGALDSVETS